MQTTCRKCHGTKVLISHPCSECGGKGQMILRKKLTVPVPAGKHGSDSSRVAIVGLDIVDVVVSAFQDLVADIIDWCGGSRLLNNFPVDKLPSNSTFSK